MQPSGAERAQARILFIMTFPRNSTFFCIYWPKKNLRTNNLTHWTLFFVVVEILSQSWIKRPNLEVQKFFSCFTSCSTPSCFSYIPILMYRPIEAPTGTSYCSSPVAAGLVIFKAVLLHTIKIQPKTVKKMHSNGRLRL